MGVGKTTTAHALGAALSLRVRDSDADLETLFGATGAEIAAEHGIDRLHELESAVLIGALGHDEPTVIAAAGWVVEDPFCRMAMAARARVIVVETTTAELVARSATADHRRPLDRAQVVALARRRAPLFEAIADQTIDAEMSTNEIVEEIKRGLDGRS